MRLNVIVVLVVLLAAGVAHAEESQGGDSAVELTNAWQAADDYNSRDFYSANVLLGGEPEYGGFLAPHLTLAPVDDQAGVFLGGRAGLIISSALTIGGGVSWLVEGPTVDDLPAQPAVRMVYGGGLIGLTFLSDAVIHPTFDLLIGGGEVRLEFDDVPLSQREENIFVLDMTGGIDVNVATGVRLHVGIGYRYVSGIEDLGGLDDDDLRGLVGTAQLKFGVF